MNPFNGKPANKKRESVTDKDFTPSSTHSTSHSYAVCSFSAQCEFLHITLSERFKGMPHKKKYTKERVERERKREKWHPSMCDRRGWWQIVCFVYSHFSVRWKKVILFSIFPTSTAEAKERFCVCCIRMYSTMQIWIHSRDPTSGRAYCNPLLNHKKPRSQSQSTYPAGDGLFWCKTSDVICVYIFLWIEWNTAFTVKASFTRKMCLLHSRQDLGRPQWTN